MISACLTRVDKGKWEGDGVEAYMDTIGTIHETGAPQAEFDFGRCMDENGYPATVNPE